MRCGCREDGALLQVMSHPDGDIALFNDAALVIAATQKNAVNYFTLGA